MACSPTRRPRSTPCELGIPLAEAEDLVYLADIDRFSQDLSAEEATIDVNEFYCLIKGWA